MAIFQFSAGTAFRAEAFHLDLPQVATSNAVPQLFRDGDTSYFYQFFADPVTFAYTANITTTLPITLDMSNLGDPMTAPTFTKSVISNFVGLTSDFAFYDYSSGSAVLVGELADEVYILTENYTYERIGTETQEISRSHTFLGFSGLFRGDDTVRLGDLDDSFWDPQGDLSMFMGGGNDLGIHLVGKANDLVFIKGEAGHDRLSVQGGTGVLRGGTGRDSITSLDEASYTIVGGRGADQIYAFRGTIIEGAGSGNDDYAGNGSGKLLLWFQNATQGVTADLWTGYARSTEIGQDTLTGIRNLLGGAGGDRLIGNPFGKLSEFGVTLDGGAGDDTITGTSQGDFLDGSNDDDRLTGYEGNDTIVGGYGNDRLFGDAGNDLLVGGQDGDVMAGGGGADQFRFYLGDIGFVLSDRITDFTEGRDTIDLRRLDAKVVTEQNERFVFIGEGEFARTGQLRVFQSGGDTVIEANIAGDLAGDWQIFLTGTHVLQAGDFIL